ncbi:hypothetical protein [Streptomyces sp. NPDC003077]|uniref:hypothetical protein n=1 Tax=Streptomyces sp. NPDC003077 TaxID=3154443 RepID=UPI0033B26B50
MTAPLPPRLLVADHVAGFLHAVDLPDGSPVARLEGRHLAEHAGFLALPGSRATFVDDRAGELLVLDVYGPEAGRPFVEARVPVAVPAEHLAADPTGRHLAVTTGLGRNWSAWSDQLTAIDLAAPGGPDAVRVRTRTGEPGVTVLGPPMGNATRPPARAETDTEPRTAGRNPHDHGPLVVLRHREPGALTAYRHHDLMAAAPSCPPAEPVAHLPLPDDDGHGDAYDPRAGRLFAAAGSGVHRARRAWGGALVAEPPLSWSVGGRAGGRGYYLRLDPVRRTLWSCVRGGPDEPERWPEWTNDAWWHRLDAESGGPEVGAPEVRAQKADGPETGDGRHRAPDDARSGRLELGPGLVFRLAVTARHVAYARVHPDGDELILVAAGTDGASTDPAPPAPTPSANRATPTPSRSDHPRTTARLPLPAMRGAPRRGGTPWDGVQRRAVAASPGASLVAVSRGGHGEVYVFDADRAELVTVVRMPSPLDEGGHLALLSPGDAAHHDPVGR